MGPKKTEPQNLYQVHVYWNQLAQWGNHHSHNPQVSGVTCACPGEKKKSPSKFLVGEVGTCLSLCWPHSIPGRRAGMFVRWLIGTASQRLLPLSFAELENGFT